MGLEECRYTHEQPPAHHWYTAKSPGLSIQCRSSRAHQTALARLRSGHLRSMTFVQGVKSFFTCPCSLLASPLLIFWTGISLRQLYEEQDLVSISVNRFLASKNIPVAPQPTYSPDLSPCDFFLFPKLINHIKGHHFGTLENIQTAVTDQLKAIPISQFHQCYEEWKKRLQRCVAS
ncbi:putative transposase [Trichonephila clavipes]|nr:putative transposase [Trichonephila clavipes]